RDDVDAVEELALVLVEALDLDVEDRIDGGLHAVAVTEEARELDFVGALDLLELLMELLVVDVRFEPFELIEVLDPLGADAAADRLRQARVREQDPAPWRDAVGLVVEPFRLHLR